MLKTIAHTLSTETDAISLLKADHRKVDSLFKEFEGADEKRDKLLIAREICMELAVHDKLESKIFYPATKATAKNAHDQINEGVVEHEAIRRLVAEIPKLKASDEFFESRVKVLIEYVKHHVKEEEQSMFPRIIESRTDLKMMGDQMAKAKERYKTQYLNAQPTSSKRATSRSKNAMQASTPAP